VTTIGTVTTVGGDYSRWLSEWTDGVLSQKRPPDQVAIVVNGSVHDQRAVDDSVRRLEDVGLPVRLVRLPWTQNYGRARNVAIDATSTVWAHHADVDDILLPHALSDWQELEADADVVGFGWKRIGTAGNGARRRVYGPSRGQSTLQSSAPASAVSPFRRTLWQRRPYDDRLPSGWDTALWRGFGHLNARFVPTLRPAYGYRFHRGSIFQTRRRAGDPEGVGQMLAKAVTDPSADVIVVVPWRDSGDPDRQAAWQWLSARWKATFPDWPLVEADCEGPWNKPKALNDTIANLDCRVLVVADADCIIDAHRLRWAAHDANVVPWVVPHGPVWRMDQASTARLYDEDPTADLPDDPGLIRNPYKGFPGGGLFVIGRAQWDRTGGFDPKFTGWGAEDEAFAVAADTLLGPHVRYDGPLWHLYHHPGLRGKHPQWKANRKRFGTYQAVADDRQAMGRLVGVTA
jgi:hypothetical protein